MRSLRLLDMVVLASSALLALKGLELLVAAPPTLSVGLAAVAEERKAPTPAPETPARETVPFDDISRALAARNATRPSGDPLAEETDPIVTGSSDAKPADGHGEKKDGAKPADGAVGAPKLHTQRPVEAAPPPATQSRSEPLILERLGERRQQLDQREREMEMREQLLKAAEGRIEQRVNELKTLEGRVGGAATQKEQERTRQLLDLVKMYEAMKPKDAARVFDRLDPKLLVELARQMNPRKLADIVGKMSSEAAEKLTVELAEVQRAPEAAPQPTPAGGTPLDQLPKIQGRPGG